VPESRRDPADLPTSQRAVALLQPPLTGAAASAGAKRAYVEIAAEAVRELEPVAPQGELQFYKNLQSYFAEEVEGPRNSWLVTLPPQSAPRSKRWKRAKLPAPSQRTTAGFSTRLPPGFVLRRLARATRVKPPR
jgi:hypothetical protein